MGCIIFNMAKRRTDPKLSTPLDRRNGQRLDKPIPIHYRCGSRPYERSQTADFSRSGARVRVAEPLEQDTDIYLLFDLGPRLKLTVTARMVWQEQAGDGYYAGLHFALPPDVDMRLGKWLSRQFKAS